MDMKKVPNYLCIFRIVITPFIMLIMLYSGYVSNLFPFSLMKNTAFGSYLIDNLDVDNSLSIIIAGVLFLIAIFTDSIDGHIARKYGAVSDKGKILDPLADKVLIIGIMLSFFLLLNVYEQRVMLLPVIVIILREIIVTVLRSYTAKRGVFVAASKWGKAKTLSQTIALVIYFIAFFVHFPIYGNLALIAAAIVTFISLFPYLFQFAIILIAKD
jgi:CDP-diacylglycerol--glycerol-3-phosphate 3-phosphatidyltransferase